MPLPSSEDLERVLVLCKQHGVAQFKCEHIEVTFAPAALLPVHSPAGSTFSRSASAPVDEEDEEEARYQKEIGDWRRKRGLEDDPGIDG